MRIDALSFVSAAAFRDRAHFPEEPCRPPWPMSVTDVGRDDREIFLLSEGRMEIGDGAAGASHSETSNHNACLLLLLERRAQPLMLINSTPLHLSSLKRVVMNSERGAILQRCTP